MNVRIVRFASRPAKFLSIGILGVLAACPSASAAETTPQPNIILILADDLGFGDLGCYGQKQIRTPRLDRMAAEGMRFSNFYAGSTVCAPSRCVLMTGLHTGHCYIRGNAKTDLRPEDVTLAKVLKKAGYATGLIGKWGLGHEDSMGVPTRQGFDEFFGYLDQHHAHNYYPTFLLRNEKRVALPNVVPKEDKNGGGMASKRVWYSHDLFAEEALSFVDRNKDRPFFLYLALTTPHANNEAGRLGMEVPDYGPYEGKIWPDPQKGLAAMISRMDADVGRLLDRLKQHGIDERTIVFFSSDNGPHAEGGNDPNFFDSNGPLRGTKRDLYDGGIRVPMIVRWPGRTRKGAVSQHVGYFADFLPTVAILAGVEVPACDGLSFLPTLLGREEEQKRHEFLYWEFYERGSAQAVRHGRWKGVRRPMHTGKIELYDLETDLGEEKDVADSQPDDVAKMADFLRRAHVPSPLWKIQGKTGEKSKKARQ